MGGRPCLCSVIQSTPWRAVCRGCVCSAIVACTEIIPAFVAPLHNLPPPQRKMLTLSFAHFPAHSRLCFSVSTETGSGGRKLSPTHSSSFSKIKHQLSALHTGPQKHHISTVDCQHCAGASVSSSMEQERRLSLFWNNGVALGSS